MNALSYHNTQQTYALGDTCEGLAGTNININKGNSPDVFSGDEVRTNPGEKSYLCCTMRNRAPNSTF
eukprot:2724053-Rhodomonas_salina.2